MEHVLDNPAWNALISGNKNFAKGTDQVKYFDKEVSPFAGFEAYTVSHFDVLYDITPHNGPFLLVTLKPIEIPDQYKTLVFMPGYQMIYNGTQTFGNSAIALSPLTEEHVPQMLELTKLTNPGPFTGRTIDFGHYFGVFVEDRLVAMAGQRLNPFEYAEISAVCTHPDYLGKGYAKQLLIYQINRMRAVSNIPFLHVRSDNERAIKVYQSLGFKIRKHIYFYVIKKS